MNKDQAIDATLDLLTEFKIDVTHEQAVKLVEIGMKVVAGLQVPRVLEYAKISDGERYEGEGWVMMRMYGLTGEWTLRSPGGNIIDTDTFRNDLAERNGFELKGD